MIVQALLAGLLLCTHGTRGLRPYEPLDDDSSLAGIPAVHAAPAFGDGQTVITRDDVATQPDDVHENERADIPASRQQSYQFSYKIRDSKGNTQHHSELSDTRNNRKGSYGFRDAHGVFRHVTYVADKKGFRAWIRTNEPGTRNSRPADVQIHAENPPPNVVRGALDEPAKPNVVAEPGEFAARPAVAAVPAFTDSGALPVRVAHPAAALAEPAVNAAPAFHSPSYGPGADDFRPVTPVRAIDVASGAYPGYNSKRVNRYGQVGYGGPSPLPQQEYRSITAGGVSDFEYYPESQRIQKSPISESKVYYAPEPSSAKETSPSAVPVYKSVRPFPTLETSEKTAEGTRDVAGKEGIPVGVTYIHQDDVDRQFERPQSFDIEPTGVAARYKKYLDWNRQGKFRD